MLSLTTVSSQLFINEYSASNLKSLKDNYDKYEDWFEIYNAGSESVDLNGYYFSDKLTNNKKWQCTSSITINPRASLVVWTSGRNEVKDGNIHTDFKITQTKGDEYLIISDPSGVIIDQVKVQLAQLGHSWARNNDGDTEWKVCDKPSPKRSNNGLLKYRGYSPAPQFDKKAGKVDFGQLIRLIKKDPNFVTRYTIDGKTPTTKTTLIFGDSLKLSKTTIVKARNFSLDTTLLPSLVAYSTYFINDSSTLPVFSIASDSLLLLANGNKNIRPISTLEYFDKDFNLITTSYGEMNSHGQDSWVNAQRSLDWISRDEMGYNNSIESPLFKQTDRPSYQRIIFRASGDDNFPATKDTSQDGSTHIRDEYVQTLSQNGNMELDVRSAARCLLYINGRYWGVYAIRELPDDHDYTDYYYKQDKYDLQYLLTWGQSWAEYGGEKAIKDWEDLRDFALSNNMADSSNYAKIKSEINLKSMIDYFLSQQNCVASDWLNYNVGWWRGKNPKGDHKKWGYILWDDDATFDYYINYTYIPDRSPNAKPCDLHVISDSMDIFFPEDTTWFHFMNDSVQIFPDLGKHEKILLKLIEESQEFRNLYYGRYADLMSSVYNCENMLRTLDSMVAIIAPEMPRHITRWPGGSLAEWEGNIDTLRLFIEERCQKLDKGALECYNLSGPFDLTVRTEPPGVSNIQVNTLNFKSFPARSRYFGSMDNSISVGNHDSTYKFSHWKLNGSGVQVKDVNKENTSFRISANEEITAVFVKNNVATKDLSTDYVNIFPNPISDNLSISNLSEGINYNIQLKDIAGKFIYNFSKQIGSNSIINLSLKDLNLKPGSYILQISTDNSSVNKRILVVR